MKNIIYSLLILAVCSCERGPIDGGVHSPHVNKTTLEYLRGIAKFDTVLILFEKAGLLDQLENKNTVVVPTNYSIHFYLIELQKQMRFEANDENLKYGFSEFMRDFDTYKDSMKMYIIPGELIDYQLLDSESSYSHFTKNLLGNEVQFSLEKTSLYTEWFPNLDPRLLIYKWVRDGLDPTTGKIPESERDLSNICQTQSILTTNGVLHVLEDDHDLFFSIRNFR